MTPQMLSCASARVGNPERASQMILSRGALIEGHFRLLGDLHTNIFLAFSRIANDVSSLDLVAEWLAPSVAAWKPSALVAPCTAGVGLASSIARLLGTRLYLAELDQSGRACGLIGTVPAGERVVLVNDVVTTGEGLRKLKQISERSGGSVVGATWFATRQPAAVNDDLQIPTVHVLELDLPSQSTLDCDLCTTGLAVEDALDLN